MRILVTGASGFIGTPVCRRLLAAGHEVIAPGRHAPALDAVRSVPMDLSDPQVDALWPARLEGVDVVINLVGIFRESSHASFDRLHREAPIALFEAAAASGVSRIVQLSALGADAQATTAYHCSKRAADERLLTLPVHGLVLQPSLVFAAHGASSRWFLQLAALPVLPLPAGGRQSLQPIHLDDVVEAICNAALLPPSAAAPGRVALVGSQRLSLRQYLCTLREQLGLRPAPTIAIPRTWVALAAHVGDRVRIGLLDSASWSMLERGNIGDANETASLLGRAPRAAEAFIEPHDRDGVRASALWSTWAPLLRLSLAAVWLWTGIVSLGLYPVTESLDLLARAGVPAAWRPVALYGAAALDLLLGVLTLSPRRPRWTWLAQAALILGYTVIISVRLPEYWLHPYGPLTKNLPMLALLGLLHAAEPDRRR